MSVLAGIGIKAYLYLQPPVYKSEVLGISVMVPKGWKFTSKDDPAQKQDLLEKGYQKNNRLFVVDEDISDQENSAKIMLSAARYFNPDGSPTPFDNTFDAVDAVQGYLKPLKQNMEFTVIEEPKTIILDGATAITFVGDFGNSIQQYTAVINNDTAYVLQCIAISKKDFKNNRALFDKVTKSIKFD